MLARRSLSTAVVVVAAWAGLAAWQYDEYGHECELAQQILRRQAEAVMNAVVGGIRSHRRMGRFFPEQLQAALDELAAAEDVIAAAVVSDDGRIVLTAGNTEALKESFPLQPGAFWDAAGLRYAVEFRLEPEPPGAGPGPGGGGGRGFGRGGGRWAQEPGPPSPLAAGGRFVAAVLLDRSATDALQQRAFWLRAAVALAGGLVLSLIAVAWHATVRLTEAAGRARVLESEARHLRDLSQAAAGLAHETRNPLGLIRGWMQRLADSPPAAGELHNKAQAVVEECDRITARINQFLSFARPCEPRLGAVDLAPLVAELAALVEPDLDAKGLKLVQTSDQPMPPVRADRELLRQALFNLLSNAIQFAPPQGTVEIALRPGHNGSERIEVADGGPGVAPDKVPMLFTPYFTTRSNGTGLGLAMVRRIAAAHGWESGYTPRLGGGSIFWLDGIHA